MANENDSKKDDGLKAAVAKLEAELASAKSDLSAAKQALESSKMSLADAKQALEGARLENAEMRGALQALQLVLARGPAPVAESPGLPDDLVLSRKRAADAKAKQAETKAKAIEIAGPKAQHLKYVVGPSGTVRKGLGFVKPGTVIDVPVSEDPSIEWEAFEPLESKPASKPAASAQRASDRDV
jgi:hypothetical protein